MTPHQDRPTVEVLALGPLLVRHNGQPVAVGGAKQEALLARLLVANGRPVPIGSLCEELWDSEPPRNPVHALQARISRLRSALPSVTFDQVGDGYRLDPVTVETDIARFETLREEGTWLLTDGLLYHAADRLREALALWRGPALAQYVTVPALRAEAVRLDRLWSATLADRLDIDLAFDKAADVIPELAGLLEHNPLSERSWGQLMVALYREDRVQEALDSYARARQIFSERFGAEPNSELGRMHLRILKEEPSEALLRFPLITDIAATTHPRQQPTASDAPMTSQATEQLVALLHDRSAILVSGAAGLGKTHLLRSVRTHLETQHYYAPLLSASELGRTIPLGVFTGLSGALGEDWNSAIQVIETLSRHRSRTVVLVDNVDTLDDASLFVINQLVTTARVPVILTVQDLTDAPCSIQALYDSGELAEVRLHPWADDEAYDLAVAVAGGALTPRTRRRILDAAAGNPWRLREIITGSKDSGQLVATDAGWELLGSPTPSARLAQRTGVRFDGLTHNELEALMCVAIAGEYPGDALDPNHRRALARANVVALSDRGWLRLAETTDREVLRARCAEALWAELTRQVMQVLTGPLAQDHPQAQHRAHFLALELGGPIDPVATRALAQRALGTFDERLALRAAKAVLAQDPEDSEAHRLVGVASSILNMPDAAEQAFLAAQRYATNSLDLVKAVWDHAQHHGLRRHDATAAVSVIEAVVPHITGARELEHLQRAQQRWMAVAGMGGRPITSPETPTDAMSTLGLLEAGFSGVLTGPLDESLRVLATLEHVPDERLRLVPGGHALRGLLEAMAVSYSGDLATANRLLQGHLEAARQEASESLGNWEYALGLSQLLSGDASQAHALAVSAVEHLQWRDITGLLPAAQALHIACAQATGQLTEPVQDLWEAIPSTATQDPKVVMLRHWTQARSTFIAGQPAQAAAQLVEAARWLMSAQHTYFAAMCAHYAVRTGFQQSAALEVLTAAAAVAGGGFIGLLVQHAEATLAQDHVALGRIARQAHDLGMLATAADTWAVTAQHTTLVPSSVRSQHQQAAMHQLYAQAPGLVSWVI